MQLKNTDIYISIWNKIRTFVYTIMIYEFYIRKYNKNTPKCNKKNLKIVCR